MIKNNVGISKPAVQAALAALGALGALGSGGAVAADWSFSGMVRQEFALATTDKGNINNQQANLFNGVTEPNNGLGKALVPTLTRPATFTQDNSFNQFLTRLELNLDGKLSETWSAHFKLRGILDEMNLVEKKAFNGDNGYETGAYQQPFFGGQRGTPFEVTGKNGMIDLPKAYLDYNSGPLWLRFGNQQIAWGEALFFRVSDTVNGLDLRRHLTFGVGAEEYSDSRVPSLGIRGSYRMNETWDIEAFTQQFQPTILPGPNSPYNLIPSQFIVDEKSGFDDVKNKWNFGARLSGNVGAFGVKGFAVRRYDPDGQYKWARADGIPGAIPGTVFVQGTGLGVYSAAEWMRYAAHSRLNGLATTQVNEAPFIGATTALGVPGLAKLCGAPSYAVGNVQVDTQSMNCLLDSFFTPAAGGGVGNLRGVIRRDFPHESVFGFSVNRVFEGEPDTLMDQLIGRFELSYTPKKKFTETSLSQTYIEHDETIFAFIFEKYHKFSQDVPATYFVAQWMHRSASDIFGRALERMNAVPGFTPTGQTGGADYVVLAFQQPSPTLAWRFDASALTDFHGGWFLQPGVRYRPSKEWQFDVYANIIKSLGAQTNRNFAQGLENANEVFARVSYAF